MKPVKVKINLYQFDELSEEAKEKAIEEHRQFLLEATYESDYDFEGDYEARLEEIENSNEPVIECIRINEYWFFEDGELANCTTYCGKHPKSGITEFNYMGSVYQI